MSNKILVLGATGNVGTPLVKALVAKGENVKAASRTGKAVEGAEGVVFNYTDPDTFGPALDGVDRAYVMLASGSVDAIGLLTPVLEAAFAKKVKVVFQSVFGVDADDSIPYRQIEIAIEKSGVPYVILRPNWFSDNFHTYWKAGIDHGQIAVPAGDGKSSFIDARDIAASAAAALTTDAFNGRAFNLTGVGVPADYAGFLASSVYPVREGWTAAVTTDVETLTGKAPRSVETYAKDHIAALNG